MDLIDRCVSVGPKTVWRIIDEEAVVATDKNKKLNILSELGTKIWMLIQDKKPVNKIIDEFSADLKMEKSEIEGEVLEYIEKLISSGYIIFCDNGKNISKE